MNFYSVFLKREGRVKIRGFSCFRDKQHPVFFRYPFHVSTMLNQYCLKLATLCACACLSKICNYGVNLQVTLSPDNNPDTPLFTTPVGVSSYFQFPSVPNDGKVYVVRLVSSLSTVNYQYTRPESTVTASGVRAHVSFNFEPQVSKSIVNCALRNVMIKYHKQHHRKVQLGSFHLNGHTSRFRSKPGNLESPCIA